MNQETPQALTQLLKAISHGDPDAPEQLWRIVYDELRSLAAQQMATEAPGHTLQPTALVHEAYFRLFGNTRVAWANHQHFFAAAAKVMRDICVDHARKRKRLKRGGGGKALRRPVSALILDPDPAEVLAVNEALERLEQVNPRKADVVMLRYFARLTVDECAAALGVSRRTIDNEWRLARAWLYRELSRGDTTVTLTEAP